ncbi:unnamed protein product [Litomosoides sigmodontis]|uniref:Uncharacterized protein n=1 Tax=Litomosoides sigmodontis TaxID=42156 RepID=A0A3P6USR5_LITSI|nr:unnamed protein product [Litomosoides sigmodontis]
MAGRIRRLSMLPDGRTYQSVKFSDSYHHVGSSNRARRRNRLIVTPDRLCVHFSSPAVSNVVAASGTGGANSPIVAIDGKIEQAMDLVKAHLMFAVREEVDVLRAKILELEATILQLEAENAVLREHVPVEILNKLSMQTTPTNSSTTAAAAV